MPTPGADRPIQRVPSGLFGPGGIGFWPAAHGEFGGYHHGFRHLTTIWKRPSGGGDVFWPVAAAKSWHCVMPGERKRRLDVPGAEGRRVRVVAGRDREELPLRHAVVEEEAVRRAADDDHRAEVRPRHAR